MAKETEHEGLPAQVTALTEKDRDPNTWNESISEEMYADLKPWMLLSHGGCRSQSLPPSLEDSSLPLPQEDKHLPERKDLRGDAVLLGVPSTDSSSCFQIDNVSQGLEYGKREVHSLLWEEIT